MRGTNLLMAAVISSGVCLPAWGIVLNQVDTFQGTATTLNWAGGAGPTNIANGGPTGTGDRFLRIRRTTTAGHLATRNISQWAGDYLTAGVGAIQIDLNHMIGATPVKIRMMVFGPGGTWASTLFTTISAGAWNTYTFSLGSASMSYAPGLEPPGTGVLADTLAGVTRLMIRHDPAVTPTGPREQPEAVTGTTLGIDNIRAIAPLAQLGDTDGDFDVDTTDLLAVKDDFGNSGPTAPGDADGDGDCDIDDLVVVKNNFGASFPGLSFVPEPASVALLALSALAILHRRREPLAFRP